MLQVCKLTPQKLSYSGDSWRTRTLGIPRSEITLEGERIFTRLSSGKYDKLNFCSSAPLQHL